MSFPRYESYKDSGVEWLGDVPEHWVACRFSRVILAIKDGTHGTFPRMSEGKVFLSAKNVNNGRIEISDDESLITLEDHNNIVSNGFPQKGDLLLTIVGTIGRSCVYSLNEAIAFQRSVCFIRLKKSCLPQFFYFLTQSKFFQEQLQSKSKSSAQAGVYMGDVSATSIMFPTNYEEQQTIASFLDCETAKIDALIAEQKRLIGLLKEKRQSVISHAVTKGLNPNAPMKDSGVEWMGKVPEHWEISRLGFESWVRARLGWKGLKAEEYVDDGFAFLSTPNIKGASIDFENVNFINEYRYDESPEIKLRLDDVLLAKDGSTLGIVNIVRSLPRPTTVNSSIAVITPNQFLSGIFLYYLFQSSYMENTIQRIKGGMGVPHLFQGDLNKFYIPLPTIDEQRTIAVFLDGETAKLDTLTTEAKTAITLLQERRTALISAAVTGKIDVRGLAPTKPEVEQAA